MYPSAKALALTTGLNLASGTVKADLIDTGTYTYSSGHDFYNDVSGVVGTAATLGSKTTTNGVFDAADATFSAVSGNSVEAIIIWVDTGGASSTDPLIVYFDTGITGAPVTPNGGDIVVQWNASGIFSF
jgi:hypothetical protein